MVQRPAIAASSALVATLNAHGRDGITTQPAPAVLKCPAGCLRDPEHLLSARLAPATAGVLARSACRPPAPVDGESLPPEYVVQYVDSLIHFDRVVCQGRCTA